MGYDTGELTGEEAKKVLYYKRRKYLKRIGLLCIVCIVVFAMAMSVYASYLNRRSERYIRNLPNYEGFFPTARRSHYTESVGDFSLIIYGVFTIRYPEVNVELTLHDVYWEEVNDYIDIALYIHEDLQGKYRYSITYDSKPVRGTTLVDENGESVTYHTQHTYKNRGRFGVDENMNPIPETVSGYSDGFNYIYQNDELLEVTSPAYKDYEYKGEEALARLKDFVYQNEEALTQLTERANFYWDLGLAYHPN